VPAFEELAGELAIHGAPAHLVRGAIAAAEDERRHARAVAALAERRGATPPAVERAAAGLRSLRALAEDNAVEGCVREAYAALVAAHQARHATDDDVRASYAAIAADEARHALLSFAIHDWARSVLPRRDADAIEARRRNELEAWRLDADHEDAPTRAALGLPDPDRSAAMLAILA
jgi:hypothetical protein